MQERELLDYDGAAAALNCTPRLVRRLVETRQIDVVKVGKLVRFEPEAIDAYIERRRRQAVLDGFGQATTRAQVPGRRPDAGQAGGSRVPAET